MARFFLNPATTAPHHLKDAPGGPTYMTETADQVARGKVVFAERCARCHSSKAPPLPAGLDLENCNGRNYLTCWNQYWEWTRTDAFKTPMTRIVQSDDFLTDNFLSTELRVPVTLLQTNACSPLATNAIGGNIWDNFSSASYKELPPVGTVKVKHPFTGAESDYTLLVAAAATRGRPARERLVHMPFPEQHGATSTRARGRCPRARVPGFDRADAVAGKREKDVSSTTTTDRRLALSIGQRSTAIHSGGFVPDELVAARNRRCVPFLFRNGNIEMGPFRWIPVSLL